MARVTTIIFLVFVLSVTIRPSISDKEEDVKAKEKRERAERLRKKDVRDYNDADVERLFEQWEEDEEKDPDDLMEHERPAPKIDFSKMDPKNPESILQMSKKGKTLMMFVSVSGNPSREESETITQRWQDELFNANFQLQRYMVDDDRAIFLLKDGSLAWELKNFVIKQDRCHDVTIENKMYYGKGSGLKTNKNGELLDGEVDPQKNKGKEKKTTKKKKTEEGDVKVAGSKKENKVEDNKTEL